MRFHGIDPGQNGACVTIGDDGETALDFRVWAKAKDPPPEATELIEHGIVSIEAMYVGGNPYSALFLSEWIGWCRAMLPRDVAVLRPNATKWRGKVLRRPFANRDAAKTYAIAMCVQHSGLPEEVATDHNVAEAWCMARYSWGWWRKHGGKS